MSGRLSETALAGPEHLDAGYVAVYDRKAAFDPTADIAALCAHGLDSNSTLVDFGAGTGTFAVAAARLCKRVVAVDVSPAMVEAIRAKVAATGTTNVECLESGCRVRNRHRRLRDGRGVRQLHLREANAASRTGVRHRSGV